MTRKNVWSCSWCLMVDLNVTLNQSCRPITTGAEWWCWVQIRVSTEMAFNWPRLEVSRGGKLKAWHQMHWVELLMWSDFCSDSVGWTEVQGPHGTLTCYQIVYVSKDSKKLDSVLTKSVYSLLFVFLFAEQTVVEVEDDRTLALHCSSEEKTELGSASWA